VVTPAIHVAREFSGVRRMNPMTWLFYAAHQQPPTVGPTADFVVGDASRLFVDTPLQCHVGCGGCTYFSSPTVPTFLPVLLSSAARII
jgi:hypothetical protein